MFPDVYHSWLLPIVFVLFHKMYSKHLDILEKNGKLHSIIEGSPFWFLNVSEVFGGAKFVFVWRFPEEAPKLPENFPP